MRIVGIDLGTTNSLVSLLDTDGPVTLVNELGDHLTPSAVAIAEDGTRLVGRAARDRLAVAPRSGRAFFKRDMGTSTTYSFGGRKWTPTECSAAVLAELKRIAALRLGGPVDRAVVTVPAYFHEPQRRSTIEAARIAGLQVAGILNEPTAAALAYGYARAHEERKVLVLDLGGGTFDVTLLETFEGVVEVRASGGDSRLGGEDWTDALLVHALAKAGVGVTVDERARLRPRAEVAKRILTTEASAEIDLGKAVVSVTRAEFVEVTAALSARLRPIVRRVLRDAKVEPADLDEVLLAGGASRMPAFLAFATEDLGREPNRVLDPDRVVALGAAVQAARVDGEGAVRDVVMTDVCPHSLGVEVSREIAGRHEAGYYLPILDRNLTVPVSRSERLHTLHPTQDVIELQVYQGESRLIAENTLLGRLEVRGLRHRPEQREPGVVDVRFTLDANGILEVEATVGHSGETRRLVLERTPGSLTAAQVEEAIRRLQPLKIRPRDLLPNRARLERAYRLWAELLGPAREDLGRRIDAFESALATEDGESIQFAAALVDTAIEDAFRGEDEAPLR
jgi:molecular chaperone HscC